MRNLTLFRKLAFVPLLALFASILIVPAMAAGSSQIAVPATKIAIIDGQKTTFYTYTIRNADYFKLRDLAFSFSGTAKQFSIGVDSANKAIKLTSGKPYKPSGGEMASKGSGKKTPFRVTSKILADGKEAFPVAYTIDNLTYVKILDLGAAFDFDVTWDESSKAYIVNTDKKYVAPTPTQLAETEEMGRKYLDSIIYLGDSTTYGFQVYGVLSGGTDTKQVWTPADRTFSLFNQKNIKILYPETKENLTIEKAVATKKPAYMVITLGINGVASMDEDYFSREYRALVKRILEANPNTKIILNSIFPVARSYGLLGSINNEKIEKANGWIFALAEELDVRYLDSASVLRDSEGWLMPKYDAGDGLHLKPEAYKAIVQYINTHGYK